MNFNFIKKKIIHHQLIVILTRINTVEIGAYWDIFCRSWHYINPQLCTVIGKDDLRQVLNMKIK